MALIYKGGVVKWVLRCFLPPSRSRSCISIELQSKVLWHKFGHLLAPLGGQFAHLLCSNNIKGAVTNTRTHSTFLKQIGEGSLAWFEKLTDLQSAAAFMDVAENKGDVGRHQGVVGEEEDLRDEEPWRRSPKRTAVQWKDEQLGVTWKVHRLLGQMGYWTAMIRPPGELVGDLTSRLFLSEMRKFFSLSCPRWGSHSLLILHWGHRWMWSTIQWRNISSHIPDHKD